MSNSVPKDSIREISFVGSFPNVTQTPVLSMPEFAFIGRSNVGKSSLINYLSARKNIAKTSSTPGKTQMINLFEVDHTWILADLPGYGYARVSKKKRSKFSDMIESYLTDRKNLVTVFLLIDIRHDPLASDIQQIRWLASRSIPFSIIYTKSDKLKPQEISLQEDLYLEKIDEILTDRPNYFITTATKKVGGSEVLEYIHYVIKQISENKL